MKYQPFGSNPMQLSDLLNPNQGMDLSAINSPLNFGATPQNSFWDSMIGGTDKATGDKFNGWGGMALNGAQALGNAWMGMKQYGLAKDTFNENKRQFGLNFGAQQKMTNSRLADRQAARVASNANAYQSVGDYMKQYGV